MKDPQVDRAIVLGGGIAGISAALELAKAGFEVELFEKRGFLGGRASSFLDPQDGEFVDNCQHVSLRACTELDRFFREIGAQDLIRYHRQIPFLDERGELSVLESSPLPAPLHFLPSLIRFRALRWGEKFQLARAMFAIWRMRTIPPLLESLDFRYWLEQHGQSVRVITRFWEPILVSALNEKLETVSAKQAVQTVQSSMLENRNAYEVGIPTVPLGEIYSVRGLKSLQQRGVTVHLQNAITQIEFEEKRVRGIALADGRRLASRRVLSALPFAQLLHILPEALVKNEPYFQRIALLENSPIVSVQFWFDRRVTDLPFAALLGTKMQWAFSRGNLLSLVVSAAYELESWSKEQLTELALRELRDVFPASVQATILKSRVIKERAATFAAKPGTEALRPSATTPIEGLILAGDWVQTGWPATMEGAVRSGKAASALIF